MKRRMLNVLGVLAVAGTVACSAQAGEPASAAPAAAPAAAAPAAPAATPATVSVYSGVYNAAQATRGQQIQQRECGSCHTPADWERGRIIGSWTNQPAYALVDHIRQTMPMDSPGRLSLQQYTDVFAYMLQINGVPAGDAELPATEEGLRRVTIEYRR